MEDHEFDAIVRAQQAEIDLHLDNPENCELHCREVDGNRILGMLVPCAGGRERKTFVISGRDEDGEVTHEWAEDLAAELFLLYMAQYACWDNPTRGAVSPRLGEFFTFCHPETPAMVNWARWLRLPHETDDGGYTVDPELAEVLVEVMIVQSEVSPTEAEWMRRAVGGEPLGECDPNQLELF
jgi:hypothetical protein